jgi:hypothetical protein
MNANNGFLDPTQKFDDDKLAKFELKKDEKRVVNFVTNYAFEQSTFFDQRLKSLYHFMVADKDVPEVCRILGTSPKSRVYLPVVVYNGDPKTYGGPVSCFYMTMAKTTNSNSITWNDLVEETTFNTNVADKDTYIVCTDGKYRNLKISLHLPAGECKWKKDPELKPVVDVFLEKYKNEIRSEVVRYVTLDEVVTKLKEFESGGGEAAGLNAGQHSSNQALVSGGAQLPDPRALTQQSIDYSSIVDGE